MKKTLFTAVLFLLFYNSKAQGVHFGVGSGTEILSAELGYSINEYLHAGVRYSTPLIFNKSASFIGVYVRKNFEKMEFGENKAARFYVGASAGFLERKEYTVTEIGVRGIFGGEEKIFPAKSSIGFSGDLGFEILYGANSRFGTFTEVKLGQVSNVISPYLSGLQNDDEAAKVDGGKTFWGINFGMRFYLGSN
jgi:hypothetical protein